MSRVRVRLGHLEKIVLNLLHFFSHQRIFCLLCDDAIIVFIQDKKCVESRKIPLNQEIFLESMHFLFSAQTIFFFYLNCLVSRIYFSE